ncbi:hypothetical protein ACOMHN_062041 [Nucella lapillus]
MMSICGTSTAIATSCRSVAHQLPLRHHVDLWHINCHCDIMSICGTSTAIATSCPSVAHQLPLRHHVHLWHINCHCDMVSICGTSATSLPATSIHKRAYVD